MAGHRKFDFSHLTKKQKANVLKWVKALESGKYKQGREQLCTRDKNGKNPRYCCLGVANEIFNIGQDESDIFLREDKAKEILGFLGAYKTELDDLFQSYLVGLNDFGRRNFRYIAKRIRQHMLGEQVNA